LLLLFGGAFDVLMLLMFQWNKKKLILILSLYVCLLDYRKLFIFTSIANYYFIVT